ncbi:MAG: hypothetical protein V4721_09000 [Bacteroidota bacterium]
MEYEEFKKRYQAQLMIGQVIDLVSDLQLNVQTTKLENLAKSICPAKGLDDAHWLINPIHVDLAWKLHGSKTDAS